MINILQFKNAYTNYDFLYITLIMDFYILILVRI
jgi:hypothetical protein